MYLHLQGRNASHHIAIFLLGLFLLDYIRLVTIDRYSSVRLLQHLKDTVIFRNQTLIGWLALQFGTETRLLWRSQSAYGESMLHSSSSVS